MRRLFGGAWPSLVMFDLDGTLVDSVPDLARAIDQMLAALGRVPAGEAKVRQWVGNGADMLVRRALSDSAEPIALEDELFSAARELFFAAYAQCNGRYSALYPGTRELLDHLRAEQVPMAVVTNKPEAFTHPLLQQLGLADYFPLVIGGDSLPNRKPHPEPLLMAIGQQACEVSQALMIGDSRNDVEAARAAGCPVVGVSYGYNYGEPISASLPDRTVDSLGDLI